MHPSDGHLLLNLLDQDLVTSPPVDVLEGEEEEEVEEEEEEVVDVLNLSRVLLAMTTIAS